MESFEGFRKSGTFIVAPALEVQGDLILGGDTTTLDLYSTHPFTTHTLQDGCILGWLHDRTKVSLIKCITTQGLGSGSRGKERYHYASVFPHFVVFGDEHITSADHKITGLSFHIDDAAELFQDFHAFGQVMDASSYMERIVETEKVPGKNIAVGEDPMVWYFTGKYEIFRSDTALGTISATHRPTFTTGGPKGIKVENEIHLDMSFKNGVTVDEAITRINTLLRFLEIIAGRPQTLLRLAFVIQGPEAERKSLDVYWSMSPSRTADSVERAPHPADLPIQAAISPEYFGSVLAAWVARDQEWRNARFRFSAAFAHQHRFTIDRLVGAANMFDILPSSAAPPDVPLTKEMEEARAASRAQFEALPQSPERNSILSALGRLGKASLKRKVRARAKLILDRIPAHFPDLEDVIDQAVDCRNYFVHSSKARLNYSDEFDQVILFTETLEFIFAASDLIECGWDIIEWSKQSSAMSHPFDQFRLDYERRLADLKRALAVAKAADSPDSTGP